MQYNSLLGFSGINRQVSHFLHETGEFAEAQNFTTNKVGVLKKAGDYQIQNAQITASQDILGGTDFLRADGTHTHIVVCDGSSNADIYEDVASTWTAESQSLTAAAKVRFAQSTALDTLFAVNKSDATRSYPGSTWSTTTNVTDAPKADIAFDFANRMNLFNVTVSTTDYEDRMYRSSLVDEGSITWDSTEWVTFEDRITGVGKHMGDLFVGCESSIQIWTTNEERYYASQHGCTSHEGIASFGRWTFWPARDGIYAWDGGNDQKISLAVQDYWDLITEANLTSVKAGVLGHHLYYYIGDITLEGRALANVMLDYDILQNNWNRFSLADEVKNIHPYITSSGKKLFIGDDNGTVYQMFASSSQNTAAFSSFIETHWDYGSGARFIDTFRELWGVGNKLSGLKVSYKVDDGEWQPVGELNGVSDMVGFKARGYRIKFLLEEVSKNNMFELHSLDLGFNPAYERVKGE